MKELKKGDFTGIYSSIDGKPLYFTGVYSCMEYDGMPCVFLATDLHNNLTFCRWSQQDLNKRGFTIPPEPVRISKTAMQMIQKAGAVIRWTTVAERKAANTDHKRMSAYIITTAAGDFYTTGTCADVREILKAAQAAPLPEESTPESCQKSPQEENMRRFTIYTDSNMAGIDSRGAYTTLAEARMRLEKELDEDETSRGGYIFDELRQKVTAIYNGFNLEKIPEPHRGTPNEYTTRKQQDATRAMLESIMNKCSEPTPATSTEANQDTTTGAQDGPTAPESNTAGENTTGANNAPEEATQRPKRRMAYIVECRSPRGSWTAYSDEQPTHEAAEKIKEEAENRHALTPDGAPIFYRLVTIDKGPEAPQEGPTTAGTTAANETPTTAETAPQDATTGPETSTAARDTTGSDTRPQRATEDATTGNAAGDTSTPANQEPGTAAGDHTGPTTGNTSGAAAEAITGRTTTQPPTAGHACENAPGRTKRAQADKVHTQHAKSPPRATQKAGRNTSRGSPDRRKVTFSAWMYKTGSDPPKI